MSKLEHFSDTIVDLEDETSCRFYSSVVAKKDDVTVSFVSENRTGHYGRPRRLREQANQSGLKEISRAQFHEMRDNIAPYKSQPGLGQKL